MLYLRPGLYVVVSLILYLGDMCAVCMTAGPDMTAESCHPLFLCVSNLAVMVNVLTAGTPVHWDLALVRPLEELKCPF